MILKYEGSNLQSKCNLPHDPYDNICVIETYEFSEFFSNFWYRQWAAVSTKYSDIRLPPHHLPYGSLNALSHISQMTAANQGNSPSLASGPLATAGIKSGFFPHSGYSGNFASTPVAQVDVSKANRDIFMLKQGKKWLPLNIVGCCYTTDGCCLSRTRKGGMQNRRTTTLPFHSQVCDGREGPVLHYQFVCVYFPRNLRFSRRPP